MSTLTKKEFSEWLKEFDFTTEGGREKTIDHLKQLSEDLGEFKLSDGKHDIKSSVELCLKQIAAGEYKEAAEVMDIIRGDIDGLYGHYLKKAEEEENSKAEPTALEKPVQRESVQLELWDEIRESGELTVDYDGQCLNVSLTCQLPVNKQTLVAYGSLILEKQFGVKGLKVVEA